MTTMTVVTTTVTLMPITLVGDGLTGVGDELTGCCAEDKINTAYSIFSLRGHSCRSKANRKEKKIKEQAKEIKDIKVNFSFAFAFAREWASMIHGLNGP